MFNRGQHVVCIRNEGVEWELTLNKVYTVRKVGVDLTFRGIFDENGLFVDDGSVEYFDGWSVYLEEIIQRVDEDGCKYQLPEGDFPFDATRFRPLQKIRVEDFVKTSTLINA